MHEVTLITRTVPGVDEALRARLVVGLNQNLASLTDVAAAYKQAHWNVVGIDFSQLHELFDELAHQVYDYMDLIAERAVTLGGVALGTIQAAAERSTLAPFPLTERSEMRLLEELLGRLDLLSADLRQAMLDSADEPATQDVYIDVVRGIEKQRWFLQSHLARPHAANGKDDAYRPLPRSSQPSTPTDSDLANDPVTEASRESFPASDPPGWGGHALSPQDGRAPARSSRAAPDRGAAPAVRRDGDRARSASPPPAL